MIALETVVSGDPKIAAQPAFPVKFGGFDKYNRENASQSISKLVDRASQCFDLATTRGVGLGESDWQSDLRPGFQRN